MIIESMILERGSQAYLSRLRTRDSLADAYGEAQQKMLEIHDGYALAEAAEEVLSQLPAGPVSLLATSVEGVALAAVCAARRADGTDWQRVDHGRRDRTLAHRPVVVEPVDGGSGWRKAILRRHPDAVFVSVRAYPVAA
jgi:hypothetical protein